MKLGGGEFKSLFTWNCGSIDLVHLNGRNRRVSVHKPHVYVKRGEGTELCWGNLKGI